MYYVITSSAGSFIVCPTANCHNGWQIAMDLDVGWRVQHCTGVLQCSLGHLDLVSCKYHFTMYTWFHPVPSVYVHLQDTFCTCL